MKAYKKKEIIIKRGGTEIQKQSFHQHEGSISIKNIDINKIVISDKSPLIKKKGCRYFFGFTDDKK